LKIVFVVLLAGLGLLFLAVGAAFAGGIFNGSAPGWLLYAGLASWCASWLVSVLPIP
jgi:hypothetical protein